MKLYPLTICVAVSLTLWFTTINARASAAQPSEWTIDGETRQALVIPPAKLGKSAVPVVLVFHGHGGTMQSMEAKGFQKQWPEAILVCPQGLPTATRLDPDGKRAGWQMKPGDDNRDLKFVDAILKTLRQKYVVDDNRIFATGHSNGGGFTYLLGAERGDELAAIAPVAAGAGGLGASKKVKPLPVLHIAGKADNIVPFENQQRTMEAVRKLNGCDSEGRPWAKAGDLVGILYPSSGGTPFVTVIHPGTHKYPDEAPELIVRFFKEQARQPPQ